MGRRTWTTSRAKELADSHCGELVSDTCESATAKLIWKCEKGHVWEAPPYVINRGSWCPWCSGRQCVVDPVARTKKCPGCGEIKSFDEFVKDPRKKWGITADCKECRKKRSKSWAKKNPDKVRALRMSPEEMREWRKNNPDKNAEYGKRWREKNREKIAASARKMRKTNPNYRILSNLRGRLNDALKRGNADKLRPISELIGCTIKELKAHLESQFVDGMSWDNYGKGSESWHIDHIVPCSSFDLQSGIEQSKCFHFSNLQPLWEADNLRKGANKSVERNCESLRD